MTDPNTQARDRLAAAAAFRDWLATELRDAGCDIRTLSPEGMAKVTAKHMTRDGWALIPPGGQQRTSWAARVPTTSPDQAPLRLCCDEASARQTAHRLQGRVVFKTMTTWPTGHPYAGHTLVGPWRPAPDTEPHVSLVDQHLPGCPAATDDGGPCRCDDEPEESR